MMTEHNCENSLAPSQPVGEPLFDDEQTILTARSVVPLEQIDRKRKLKSRFLVVGAFALAILLGGASGLISAYFKLREVDESGVAQVGIPTQPGTEEPPTLPALKVAVTEDSNASFIPPFPALEEQRSKPFIPKRVARPRPITQSMNHSVISQQLSEDEELSRIRQDVLIEESQGRRMKGVERREGRRPERN